MKGTEGGMGAKGLGIFSSSINRRRNKWLGCQLKSRVSSFLSLNLRYLHIKLQLIDIKMHHYDR